jgi:hypothetical protein
MRESAGKFLIYSSCASPMRYLLVIAACILSSQQVYCQQTDFVELVFRNKNNLRITETFHSYPEKIYLLAKPILWNRDRLIVNKNSRRHAEARNPYVFLDSSVARLFSEEEKNNLSAKVSDSNLVKLETRDKKVHLIHSPMKIKGFLFSMTNPIYNSDSTYAFVDLHVYFKNNRTSDFDQAYYGSILFLFRRTIKEGWTLIKQIEEIIL